MLSSRPASVLLFALILPLLGAGPCSAPKITIGLPSAAAGLPVFVTLADSSDPAQVRVEVAGEDVTSSFQPGGPGLVGSVPVPPPGVFKIVVTLPEGPLGIPVTWRAAFVSPGATPVLVESSPTDGQFPVWRTHWIDLRFAGDLSPESLEGWSFGLECDGETISRSLHRLGDRVLLNPKPQLPPDSDCRVSWRGASGNVEEVAFSVVSDVATDPGFAVYDRTDPFALAPFPDDYFTDPDADAPTGLVVDVPVPDFADPLQQIVFDSLVDAAGAPDGWSRESPIVLQFSHEVLASQVPVDAFDSMDPANPVWIVDIDAASPDFGQRVPYRMLRRQDPAPDGSTDFVLLLFPQIDLRAEGRYAVAVNRSLIAASSSGRSFGPSSFFAAVKDEPRPGEAPQVARARGLVRPVLDVLGALPDVPLPEDDVALAFPISVRSHVSPADLVFFKEHALASPPPEVVLPDPDGDPCPDPETMCLSLVGPRALRATGHVVLPEWRGPAITFVRDPVTGLPVQQGTNEVPFRMTLPFDVLDGPVPAIFYQHGNPGSPNEIFGENTNGHLDDAGFALLAIQDTLNREVGQDVPLQTQTILFLLAGTGQLPDFWNQTGSDMIHFLRAIEGLGELDLVRDDGTGSPEIGTDGQPELDPSAILYKGISEGGNNAQRFLPFAPEFLAATPVVGGTRLAEILIHQGAEQLLETVGTFLPQVRPMELWVGLSLFQLDYDPQDGHNFLRHLYREPLLPFVGSSDATPTHTLWTEGVGDTLVANNATRAAAIEVGVPHVLPVAEPVPGLEQISAPVVGNLPGGLTGGFFQYDPATTPSCVAVDQPEGHFCAQTADEAQGQRLHFFETALEGTPEILSLLP
ncbi:MAG: hypothetical protein OEP95_01915 [Myxococcales bacterium]|nr:hypothetical protein [Myxococcales bacterium]